MLTNNNVALNPNNSIASQNSLPYQHTQPLPSNQSLYGNHNNNINWQGSPQMMMLEDCNELIYMGAAPVSSPLHSPSIYQPSTLFPSYNISNPNINLLANQLMNPQLSVSGTIASSSSSRNSFNYSPTNQALNLGSKIHRKHKNKPNLPSNSPVLPANHQQPGHSGTQRQTPQSTQSLLPNGTSLPSSKPTLQNSSLPDHHSKKKTSFSFTTISHEIVFKGIFNLVGNVFQCEVHLIGTGVKPFCVTWPKTDKIILSLLPNLNIADVVTLAKEEGAIYMITPTIKDWLPAFMSILSKEPRSAGHVNLGKADFFVFQFRDKLAAVSLPKTASQAKLGNTAHPSVQSGDINANDLPSLFCD